MAVIFYYVLKEKFYKLNTGIKILQNAEDEILVEGMRSPCIMGLLNPKDDLFKYKSSDYICLELEVSPKDCFVLNGDLKNLNDKQKYYDSVISLKEYKFGFYRYPEVALVKDVEESNIKVLDEVIGAPIIFEDSDSLYKSNVFEEFRQKYGDFDETLLAVFFMLMSRKGKFKLLNKKVQDNDKTLYVYKDNETEKIYTISIKEGKNNG